MQVFKIRLTSQDPNISAETAEVKYRKGFEMFGEKFVCHKDFHYENVKMVSHFKSGIAIARGKTYKDAMAEAKRLLFIHCNENQDFIHLLENYAGDQGLHQIEIN